MNWRHTHDIYDPVLEADDPDEWSFPVMKDRDCYYTPHAWAGDAPADWPAALERAGLRVRPVVGEPLTWEEAKQVC